MDANLIVWDVDRVWYGDISTTYAAKGSTQRFEPHLREAYEKGHVTPEQVEMWQKATGRKLGTPGNEYVGALAEMYTDLFYGMTDGGVSVVIPKGTISKEQTIAGKQALLKGLTIGDVKRIADAVPYNPGLVEAIEALRASGVHQAGFSDGLGPFVAYKMIDQAIEIGGIVPANVRTIFDNEWFREENAELMLNWNDVILLGKTKPFKKGPAIFEYITRKGYSVQRVATIDDSAANLDTLKKVKDNGGIGVGYRVNDAKAFQEAGVPVIKGEDLRAFGEIVKDRRKIAEFCETWGLEI